MCQFQGARMAFEDIDSSYTRVVDLSEELHEICTTFVEDKGILNQASLEATFDDANGKFNIFAKSR